MPDAREFLTTQELKRFKMLYDHQRKIVKEDKKWTGLFLSTGSGKTRTALMLAKDKTLIICPKTQFEDKNWQREAEKLNLAVQDFYVISKEMFKKIHKTLPKFRTVICDEIHTMLGATPNIRYRNKVAIPKTSQIFEALDEYLKRCPPERFYGLTATIIRTPMTVWAICKIMGKEFDFYYWRQTFYTKLPMPGREVYIAKTDTATKDKLAKVVQAFGYVGRLSDYFDVPDQIYRTIYLELTEAQKKRLKELPLEFPEPLTLLGKKVQVENGILSGNEFSAAEKFSNQKIDKLIELSDEFPRMVIFAKYTAQIEQIATAFQDTDKNVFIMQGSTKDRGEVIKKANDSGNGVFIVQSSMSAGWELPKYEVMVFASLDWSIISYVQGQGRILRANALKKNLYIHLVVKGGVDEAIYNCIMNKQDFIDRVYLNL